MGTASRLLAYGDCNTLGFERSKGAAFPEVAGKALGLPVVNLGCTMSTTRELLRYARNYPPQASDIVLVQYGLVDAWASFRNAPYVLYYPDNPLRKLGRKIAKKIKKHARTLGAHRWLGVENVVPLDEYIDNLEKIIASSPASRFFLISTPPNLDTSRNASIERYNKALDLVSSRFTNAHFVDTYQALSVSEKGVHYPDGTHLNQTGHALVSRLLLEAIAETEKHRAPTAGTPGTMALSSC